MMSAFLLNKILFTFSKSTDRNTNYNSMKQKISNKFVILLTIIGKINFFVNIFLDTFLICQNAFTDFCLNFIPYDSKIRRMLIPRVTILMVKELLES